MQDAMDDKQLAIELSHVSLVRQDTLILDDICWQVPRGALLAIVGPNGSGKTSLTRVLCGYEWPTQGVVTVLGQQLGRCDIRVLRRSVGLVNPSHRFGVEQHLSARRVVWTGFDASLDVYTQPSTDQRRRADELLEQVGLADRRDRPFALLSTGEQRRCLVARAMAPLPEVLILDEPTAGLDLAGREQLLATIDQLHRQPGGPTILLITHHVEEIGPGTDRVLLLDAGRIAADGLPEKVLNDRLLSRVMRCHVELHRHNGRYWAHVTPGAWPGMIGEVRAGSDPKSSRG
jgi:iron complex transport system ATP-binding protein